MISDDVIKTLTGVLARVLKARCLMSPVKLNVASSRINSTPYGRNFMSENISL